MSVVAPVRPAVRDEELLDTLVHRRRGRAPRGTHRMAALCHALGAPQAQLRTVHVVGTGGKTSIVRTMSSLFTALGVTCGETTSPHLQHASERIRLDGHAVRPELVAARWRDLQQAIAVAESRTGESVTFFEAVTALALRLFADRQVDVAVVEAGIGGVTDATGVLASDVVVLSRVGYDHPELGVDLAQIAREKAGVASPGGVLVCSAQDPAAAEAIEEVVAERAATLLRAGRDFGVDTRRPAPGGQQVGLRGLDGSGIRGFLPLRGAHQAANAAVALAAVQTLLGTTDLDPVRLRTGLAAVDVPGRVEVVTRRDAADVILDGAHDIDAMSALARCLVESAPGRPITVVFGVGGQRSPEPLLERLRRLDARLIVTATATPQAMPVEELERRARADGVDAIAAADPALAIRRATELTPADGVIVVTGSLHLVGAVASLLEAVRATVP